MDSIRLDGDPFGKLRSVSAMALVAEELIQSGAAVLVSLSRDEGGVLRACLGVDVQAACAAPSGKGFRVDVSLDWDHSLLLDALDCLLRLGKPCVECRRQNLPISHDSQDARVVLSSVPGDAGR